MIVCCPDCGYDMGIVSEEGTLCAFCKCGTIPLTEFLDRQPDEGFEELEQDTDDDKSDSTFGIQ